MTYYAGLDVSLKEVSICVVDGEGAVVHRSTTMTDPDVIAQHFAEKGFTRTESCTKAARFRSGCNLGW